MTVEPQNAHDPDDDDFYVLGEEDSDSSASPSEDQGNSRPRGAGAGHGPGTVAEEEDVLFVPTEEQRHVAGETPFTGEAGAKWEEELTAVDAMREAGEAGEDLAPEAEASDEDLSRYAPTGDFAIMDASAQLAEVDRAVNAGPAGAQEAGDAGGLPADGAEDAEAAEMTAEDDAWAPVESSDDPLLEGPGVGAEGGQEAPGMVGDATSAEDAAVAAAAAAAVHGPTIVAGRGAHRRRRVGGLVAAAVLLVCCGGGYLAWQQGWVGTSEEPPTLVERAEIPRPRVTVTPAPPAVVKGEEPGTDSKPGPKPEPRSTSGPTPDPKVAQNPLPPPVDPTPQGDPATPPGGAQTGSQLPDLARELGSLQVGEGLTIKETPVQESPRERVSMNGIVPGSQAFAQLRNGNFFVGSIKAVDTDVVTLKLEKGEVTLGIVDLKTIVSLASSEYRELKRVEQGFVRLNNRNRLLGTILASQDENIILENKANRVVIPRSEIEELGVAKATVRFADEDNSWVDRMIERQLSEQEAKDKDKDKDKFSPSPLVEQKAKQAEKAKVKSVVDDESGTRPK
jgi:hypothetical protein